MHPNDNPSRQVITPREWAAISLWTLTGSAAVVLGGRAISGAFNVSVPAIIPCLATATALLMNLVAWLLHSASSTSASPQRRLSIGLLSLVPVAVIGFSTSLHASPLALGVATGLLLIGLVTLVVAEGLRVDSHQSNVIPTVTPEATLVKHSKSIPDLHADLPVDETLKQLPSISESEAVDQRITRRNGEDGSEIIEAELMATFDAGVRETVIHMPIHPVMGGMPVVECEPLDESDVTVTVSNAQPYGLRLEIKRTERLHERLRVPIGVAVSASANVADVA